jgi:hypothetical protein
VITDIKQRVVKTNNYQRNVLANWITEYEFNVFGTLTFDAKKLHREVIAQRQNVRGAVSYEELKREIEIRALKRYWNKLDRKYFGNSAYRNNKRIQRFNVVQIGKAGTNTHIHFAALAPTKSVEAFKRRIDRVWKNEIKTSGFSEFSTIYDKKRLCDYLTHEYYKLGNDTIEAETTVLHTTNKQEKLIARFEKRLQVLTKAEKHYKKKMDEALKR